MPKLVMDYISLLIIFIACIDQGDGHWKERERENLRHDIELYKKMAEKIEREIESFYGEYPAERYNGENVDRIHYKRIRNILGRKQGTGKNGRSDKKEKNFLYAQSKNISNEITTRRGESKIHEETSTKATLKNNEPVKSDTISPLWPKFEDILLAMGRKYDWKNDRWLKVKRKIKDDNIKENNAPKKENKNSIAFHEKHKFSYRMIKLSKSKNRRNVVVAVSAVR